MPQTPRGGCTVDGIWALDFTIRKVLKPPAVTGFKEGALAYTVVFIVQRRKLYRTRLSNIHALTARRSGAAWLQSLTTHTL